MVTRPVPVSVTVLPVIVAGPETILKLTGNPEEAVAMRVNGASPYTLLANAVKVMVCEAFPTEKLC